ncbi:hypothetical protein TYRP_009051 [Tyrophagus putrescentiae]|nr:hypothetical protein TYRP_009051 [Tyrophagus putrescentiae]
MVTTETTSSVNTSSRRTESEKARPKVFTSRTFRNSSTSAPQSQGTLTAMPALFTTAQSGWGLDSIALTAWSTSSELVTFIRRTWTEVEVFSSWAPGLFSSRTPAKTWKPRKEVM